MRPGRGIVGPLLVLLAAWLIARERLDAVVVRGRSMAPALLPGDRLLVLRLSAPPRVGEVVLAPDPRDDGRELVKRVAAVGAPGITLHGDNPSFSTDARRFGSVPAADVRWRAVLRYWPADRIGPIPPRQPVDEGGEPARAVPDALVAGE
jgi:signal peptidase I